jgi:hypothetical protein
MSAFVVEDRTINRILGWLSNYGNEHRSALQRVLGAAQLEENEEWQERLGLSMFLQNVDAVNQRYCERNGELDLGYCWSWENPTPVQALKSLSCWLYQCSEGSIPERPLYKAFRSLEASLAKDIVSNLPEYEKAEWA